MKDIKRTVKVVSDTSTGCPFCAKSLNGAETDSCINHLIEQHGGTLLHVGMEFGGYAERGEAIHNTVALVGFTDPPAERPVGTSKFSLRMNLTGSGPATE